MPTLSQCVDEVLLNLNGYGAPASRASFLSAGITSTATTAIVTDATDFNQGVAEIGGELVYIESVDTGTNTLTFSSDGRGFYGTPAAAHLAGARITMNPVWPRVRVEAAINEAIEGTDPVLFGVASTSAQLNGVQNTFELPADCEGVLAVSADGVGPSLEQQKVRRYAVDLTASTAKFATGKCITIQETVHPRATVTVTYRTRPTAITSSDQFTVSKLRNTAWKAVRLSALSELVLALDAMRLPLDTAASAELAERNQIGSAARLSTQLWQRYQIELEQERKRLAADTPVPISVRGR